MSAQSAAARLVSAVLRCLQERIGEGARRLSALTLAALATGFYPDGSAPEPGFPRLWLAELPASPNDAAVKHAPCRPVLMPVDRGSRAARVRLAIRPRAPRLALVFTACLPERRPQTSEMAPYNRNRDAMSRKK